MRKSFFFTLLLGLILQPIAHADQPEVALSAGAFEVFDSGANATEVGAEYRFRPTELLFGAVPAIGLNINSDGGYWTHAGLRYDVTFAEKWLFTPQLALVGYEDGAGVDLGSGFLFRTGIELGYQLSANSKLSMTLYHMSNADLAKNNPGSESVILNYSFSLGSPR